jgi:uncharacterized RDD family membrane protein YckC
MILAGIARAFPDWAQAIVGCLLILSPLAYFMWMWSVKGPWPGQSLGMKALGLKVVKTDGQLLTIWMAGARVLAMANRQPPPLPGAALGRLGSQQAGLARQDGRDLRPEALAGRLGVRLSRRARAPGRP